MALSKETVKYVADLSRIELKPEELEILSKQLEGVLAFIGKLNELDISNISPTNHILPINNVLREDTAKSPLTPDKSLANAPQARGNFFEVPKVIE
ncbi:MAG: Asp-tRNA(Asn)/Glu-tRNA(Gln) amidotransferase subunit GatC [Candidatus Omnitrophica bacterium]|jgi:aspartyl-tRNA(Asn)/glutamyl-tRNA(Gln) amidotransferase subunit C|nr:Asp-tRNA(Asn)/Glu-tRNA(Gln) amidotransferase subunit GatC [Candidatus Omnitrophota bacterium]MDD5079176.1 Asp-tRNA(Asn)/Glu-tRNA(Gln) amidotransferase subunit GatC [Candidatus Omnitrophota bacterium]